MNIRALKNATLDDDLGTAVDYARTHYASANPKSAAQHEASKAFMPGGNTRSVLYYFATVLHGSISQSQQPHPI
jgi:hypothetical protein